MIISKKQFEEEVAKRAKREYRIARIEQENRQQEELIQKMKLRIRNMEYRIRELEKNQRSGSINGFYQAADGSCTILQNANSTVKASLAITEDENKCTEPEG